MEENVLDKNFDTAFAIAWSENQGGYSADIAKKTILLQGFISKMVVSQAQKFVEMLRFK